MSGCMTARRCAKVLAGGFQASPGRHVVRGGQRLQMAWLVPFLSESRALLHCELWQLRPSVGYCLPVASLR